MKFPRLAIVALSAAVLAGCLVPEKFTAQVAIKQDGSYDYAYAGTTAFAPALAQIRKVGKLSDKDEAALKGETENMKRDPDVRRAEYMGGGRYDLVVQGQKKSGQPLRLFDFLNVRTDKDGVMTISSPEINAKTRKELGELGIKIDGTLEVKLPKNAEILSHNATSTPSFFGMFGAYKWKIGSVDQQPVMKLRLKQ